MTWYIYLMPQRRYKRTWQLVLRRLETQYHCPEACIAQGPGFAWTSRYDAMRGGLEWHVQLTHHQFPTLLHMHEFWEETHEICLPEPSHLVCDVR